MLKYRAGLEALHTYAIDERDWDIKLDANESPANLPPLVRERVVNRLSYLAFNRYPEMGMLGLREQIAAEFQLSVDQVLIGNGSSEILIALCHALGGQGRSIVFPTPSFSMYGIYAILADSEAVPVNLAPTDFSLSRDKILQAAEASKANLIILCNPNNPTGTVIPPEDIEYIVSQAKCLVVVDEAYHEFYGGRSAAGLIGKYDNLVVARTFSKAYSLASARVGYMLAGEQVTQMVGKAMLPYHVNALSLAAAEVVYQMRDEFKAGISQTVMERKRMAESLRKFTGITVYPSETNFILIKLAQAQGLNSYLAERSISIRDFGGAPGLTNCLRISVGTPVENDTLLQAILEFLKRG
ncbi:MAG: histidinol-phosphate transaminase [Veillonellales bacterium]